MQISYSQVPPLHKPVQPPSSNQADAMGNAVSGLLVLFVPGCIALGFVLHKKYRAHRTAVLRKQIEKLELIWRMSPKQ
jgi:hypothetical protein